MLRKICCFVIALLVFALPLTVCAEGETEPQYYVNISAVVDGVTPQSGEFTVKVVRQLFIDEEDGYQNDGDNAETTVDLNIGNNFTYKYEFVPLAGQRYVISVTSSDLSISLASSTFYLKVLEDNELALLDENEIDVEDTTITEDAKYRNAVFNYTTSVPLNELIVKPVENKTVIKEYDGTTDAEVPADFLTVEGILEGDDVKLEYTSAKFNNFNVIMAESVTVSGFTLSGEDAGKYKVVTQKVEFSGQITPRKITVTANDVVITLGEKEPIFTYKVSGKLVGSDKLEGALARTPGNEAGKYAITIGQLKLVGNSENYDIIFKEGVFTISKYPFSYLSDKTSGIIIKGYFNASETLSVSPISATDSEYKSFFENAAWGKMISAYSVSFSGDNIDGDVTITFPVPAEYKGKEVAVYQLMPNGAVTCFKTTATDTVSMTTGEFTQFMLVVDSGENGEQGQEGKRSTVATIFLILLIILGVIVGLALIIVAFFFGMVFFNKTEELKSIIRGVRKMFRK